VSKTIASKQPSADLEEKEEAGLKSKTILIERKEVRTKVKGKVVKMGIWVTSTPKPGRPLNAKKNMHTGMIWDGARELDKVYPGGAVAQMKTKGKLEQT